MDGDGLDDQRWLHQQQRHRGKDGIGGWRRSGGDAQARACGGAAAERWRCAGARRRRCDRTAKGWRLESRGRDTVGPMATTWMMRRSGGGRGMKLGGGGGVAAVARGRRGGGTIWERR
ncbi:hypothetical protein DAI22_09g078601 [Oryza sativa Japonica Group]|nr:hypothetical protein DAI22_09g078601 [Oryza sativa Japonica Group]